MEDWDDNMQTECAKAFIDILKDNVSGHNDIHNHVHLSRLVTDRALTVDQIISLLISCCFTLQQVTILNTQRILGLAVDITTNED